ncbi:GNAT family N-acetyltransferase [candidate division KSB1 bacterium]|nr:GNAT family N-acetyltransferase [candidate division KSB1 bacterium]
MNDRLRLRALTMDDAKITWKWRNLEDIVDEYSGHPFPVNYELEKAWYEKFIYSNIPTTTFGIEIFNPEKLIGLTFLKGINYLNRETEFAIIIGDVEERGKGYAQEATQKTLAFAFFKLGLNRVFLKVIEDNSVAVKLYEYCGFVKEGILRESIFKNNKLKNQIVMSILKSEFMENQ